MLGIGEDHLKLNMSANSRLVS